MKKLLLKITIKKLKRLCTKVDIGLTAEQRNEVLETIGLLKHKLDYLRK